ncbi:MAG: hypothetical protein K5756_05270 [Clostridiales bacterium]|nr:hypothetical protein [Clostridiales bacterium]
MFNNKSKSEYYQTLGRRRKSFFEFTDIYPGPANGRKIRTSAAYRKKQHIARLLITLGIILLIIIGFFAADLLMDISELPYGV